MHLKPGDKAPEFVLYGADKAEVSLSELQGKSVLLLFFPLSFTSTCTQEMCTVRDNLSVYIELDTTVFGISVDSVHVLAKFKAENNLNFQLLSDFNKEVSRAYSALHEEFNFGMRGVSKRAAFVIDGHGVVRYAEVLDNPSKLPDFDAVINTLSQLN